MYHVLVCDDEKDIVEALCIYLTAEGYQVEKAYNGQEALEILDRKTVHLVLLDIMMPEMDGITAMNLIRQKSNIPVIMLTAKGEDTDKVLGLNLGADDYVTKPFNPVELLARVKAQLRRYMTLGSAMPESEDVLTVGDISMDDKAKQVRVSGEAVNLTKTEYEILKIFLENPGKVFSIKEIYRLVWEEASFGQENTVSVHIRHLREKIEINPSNPRYLKVVWGQGYVLEDGRAIG